MRASIEGLDPNPVQLAQAFGKRGTVANLCAGETLASGFQAINKLIGQTAPGL